MDVHEMKAQAAEFIALEAPELASLGPVLAAEMDATLAEDPDYWRERPADLLRWGLDSLAHKLFGRGEGIAARLEKALAA